MVLFSQMGKQRLPKFEVIYSFTYLFSKCLVRAHCVRGTTQGAENAAAGKRANTSILMELLIRLPAVLFSSGCLQKCRLGGLNNRIHCPTVVEAGSPRSRCWQVWLFLRLLYLACRWLSSLCVLTWSVFCASTALLCLCVFQIPLLIRTPLLIMLEPTVWASFKFSHVVNDLISKYTLRVLGLRL